MEVNKLSDNWESWTGSSGTRQLSRVLCILEVGVLILYCCGMYVTWLYCLEQSSLDLFQEMILVNVQVTLVFPFYEICEFKNRGRFKASWGLCGGLTPGLRKGSCPATGNHCTGKR